jgi:APA family basic amino acid/polyamine antiporter
MADKEQMSELFSEKTEFKREITLFGGISILGGIMIGGGIFYLGSYVLMRTGFSLGLSIIAWILGGIVSMLGGICFAELGAMIPKAGGTTVYLTTAFHPLLGFLSGFNSWVIGGPGSLSAGALALTAMFGFQGTTGKIVASVIIIGFTVFNYFGIKMGSWLQNLTMIAKLIPIFIIMIAAFIMGKAAPVLSLTPMDGPVPVGKMLSMVAFATVATLWAYEGWTNLNSVTEEIKNPKRNLPLAIILAIAGITVLYTLFNYAIMRVIPLAEIRTLLDAKKLYLGTEVAVRLLGSAGGVIVTVGMMISMLGSINGMTLAFPRNYYAMAHEGHFFKSFKKLHPKYKVPYAPLICQCFITLLLIWIRSLDQLTSLVVFTSMIYNVLIFVAVLRLRKTMPDAERPYKVWGGKFTIYLTTLINFALLINTLIEDPYTCLMGLIVPVIGSVLYFYFDRRLKAEKNNNPEA